MSNAHKLSKLVIKDMIASVPYDSLYFNFDRDVNGIKNGAVVYPTNTTHTATIASNGGKYGGAVLIDSNSDVLNLGDSTQYVSQSAFTVSAWVKPTELGAASGNWNMILAFSPAFYFGFDGGNRLRISVVDSTGTQKVVDYTYQFAVGTWYMLSAVYNAGTLDLYLNGAKVKTGTVTSTILYTRTADTDKNLRIGGYQTNTTYIANGYLDELIIEPRARTEEEIMSWYLSNTPMYNAFDTRVYDHVKANYVSKVDTPDQSIVSNLKIGGGKITLKNSILSDNTSASYLQINPQGSQLIVYDGVTDMSFKVFSRSGSQRVAIQAVGGTDPYGKINMEALNRLELNYESAKPILVNGYIAGDTNEIRFGWTNDKGVSLTHGFYVSGGVAGLHSWANGKVGFRYNQSVHSVGLLVSNDVANTVKTTNNTLEDGTGGATFAGGVTMNSTLVVSGNTTISGTATFADSSTFNNTVTVNGALNVPAANAVVKIGAISSINSPRLEFRSSGFTANDYDARILVSGGASGNGLGTMQLMSQTVTTTGVFKPYRLVLPVGTNLYA